MTIEATEHDHFLRTAPFEAIVADAKAKAPKPAPTLDGALMAMVRVAIQHEDDIDVVRSVQEAAIETCTSVPQERAELWWGELMFWVEALDNEEGGKRRPSEHDNIDYTARIREALDELTGRDS